MTIMNLVYGFGAFCVLSAVLCFCALLAAKRAEREEEIEMAAYCALEADLRHFNAEEAA